MIVHEVHEKNKKTYLPGFIASVTKQLKSQKLNSVKVNADKGYTERAK